MSDSKVYIVFNPASAGGRTWKRRKLIFSEIRKFWNDFIVDFTEKPGDAVDKTRHALSSGRNLIVAVGGDGTIREVVNGFYKDGHLINPDAVLAIINSGTGQGFAQSLGLPKDINLQFEIIKSGNKEKTDIGRLILTTGIYSYFVNEFQLGIGSDVVRSVSPENKKISGSFAFAFGVLNVIRKFKPHFYSVRFDDNQEIKDKLTGIVISNGKYTGGGMQLTPDAALNDGYLDVLLIPALNRNEMLRVFPKIYSGHHLKDKRFRSIKTKNLCFSITENHLSETDGEILNELPVKIEVIPSALNILKPKIKEIKL